MKLKEKLSRPRKRKGISTKLAVAFGVLLALILVVTISSFGLLNAVRRKTETAIITSTQMQRLILGLDAGLEKARRLQRDFFLRYPQVGYSQARDIYAQDALAQLAQTEDLSLELKGLIETSNIQNTLPPNDIDFNLYLSISERYEQTFMESIALVIELVGEPDGWQMQLDNTSRALLNSLEKTGSPLWIEQYLEIQLHENEYLATRQRGAMQAAFDAIVLLNQSIEQSDWLEAEGKTTALAALEAYRAAALHVVELDDAIRGKFGEFDAQAASLDPISKELIELSNASILSAQQDIERTNRLATVALLLTSVLGLASAGAIAAFLSNNITRNIDRLATAASELEAGHLYISAQVNSEDELGDLAHSFNRMAAQLRTSFESLQANEERYRTLFEDSPISLWDEDFSAVKAHLDGISQEAGFDWRAYFKENPGLARQLAEMVKITAVNRATCEMFHCQRDQLDNLNNIYLPASYEVFCEQLIVLAKGKTEFEAEMNYRTCQGSEIIVSRKLNLVAGHEETWDKVLVSLTDITQRMRTEKALRENEQRYRALFEYSNDAVIIGDLDGNILLANQRTAELTGYTVEELTNMRAQEIIVTPAELRADIERWQSEHGESSTTPLFECNLRCKDGSEILVEISTVLVNDTSGQPQHFQSIARDIRERKRVDLEIRRLNAELEQRVIERTAQLESTNKELEAFSYSVSHDLRAPLRSIDGFSRIIQEDYAPELPEEAHQLFGRVRKSAQYMGHLIDELLKFSRLSRQQLNKQPIEMKVMVDQALQALTSERAERHVEITMGDLPACQGDPTLLLQVWINLLSNAFKFTRTRTVAEIEIGSLVDEQGKWVYYVKDNGIGFDMEHVYKLFGVFQRLHSEAEFEGTGVGLALVQRIIVRHGGRIWAKAARDAGCTIYFTL